MSVYECKCMHTGAHKSQKRVLQTRPGVISVTMNHPVSHPNVEEPNSSSLREQLLLLGAQLSLQFPPLSLDVF